MPARERTYRVVNQRPQPVELHVAEEAVVLGPYEQADVHTLTAQIDELARRGLIVIEQTDPQPAAPKAVVPKPAAAAPKPAAAKPATVKRTAKASPAAASTRRQPSRRGGK